MAAAGGGLSELWFRNGGVMPPVDQMKIVLFEFNNKNCGIFIDFVTKNRRHKLSVG